MKKVLLSVVAVAAFAFTSNAQLFIGGNLGIATNSTKTSVQDLDDAKVAGSRMTFAPKIGFELTDKFAIGGIVSLASQKNIPNKEADKKTWTKLNSWSVAPFVRYEFLSFGDFAVKAEAVASIGMITPVGHSGNEKTKGDKTTEMALTIAPVVTYSLSDHFELEANMNFFNLSLTHSVRKDSQNANNKVATNSFNFAGNADNVASSLGITVGFIYKL